MQASEAATTKAVAEGNEGKPITLNALRKMTPEQVLALRPADISASGEHGGNVPLPPHTDVNKAVLHALGHEAAPAIAPTHHAETEQMDQIIARQMAETPHPAPLSGFPSWAAGFSEADGIAFGSAAIALIIAVVILARRGRPT